MELLLILFLILLNGFFAMAEMAMVAARRVRLRRMAEEGDKGAAKALAISREPSGFLATIQIGITLVGILAGAFGGAAVAGPLGEWLGRLGLPAAEDVAFAAVVLLITYASLILGELVPKRIALAGADRIAARIARPMAALSRLVAPVVWLLGVSGDAVLRLFRIPPQAQERVSEEEVQALIAEGTRQGVFHRAEREMIEGVLDLDDRDVASIMTPRPDVVWLDAEEDAQAIRSKIIDSGHGRFPLARGSLDNLIGIVRTRDLLEGLLAGRGPELLRWVETPLVVPETMTVLRLVDAMRKSGAHAAAVVDEHGSFAGLVTVGDVFEAVLGGLPEMDVNRDPAVARRADGSILASGKAVLAEVEAALGVEGMDGSGGYRTLGGFVMTTLGAVPSVGDTFAWNGLRFEIIDMDGLRIDKVLITPTPQDEGTGGEGAKKLRPPRSTS